MFTVPVMTENVQLDTTIVESIDGNEIEMLLFALERSRAQFAWKAGGLDAAALNRAHPPSTLTLGGLVKHLARVEDEKVAEHLVGAWPDDTPWSAANFGTDPEWDRDPQSVEKADELSGDPFAGRGEGPLPRRLL